MSKKKHSVMYIKPNEPSFLRQIKQRAGYQEPDTVDTKFEYDYSAENGSDEIVKVDEAPQIVVVKDGDISAEQYAAINQAEKEKAEKKLIDAGQIKFRKPEKRQQPLSDADTSSNAAKTVKVDPNLNLTSDADDADIKSTPNQSRLLSFDDGEEES